MATLKGLAAELSRRLSGMNDIEERRRQVQPMINLMNDLMNLPQPHRELLEAIRVKRAAVCAGIGQIERKLKRVAHRLDMQEQIYGGRMPARVQKITALQRNDIGDANVLLGEIKADTGGIEQKLAVLIDFNLRAEDARNRAEEFMRRGEDSRKRMEKSSAAALRLSGFAVVISAASLFSPLWLPPLQAVIADALLRLLSLR